MSDSPLETLSAQREVELKTVAIYTEALSARAGQAHVLQRDLHVKYLAQILSKDKSLPKSFACLNAGRPWICYWAIHGLYLLGAIDEIVGQSPDDVAEMVSFLDSCQHQKFGGFGGGPGQLPHLATTYAAVSALVTLGTEPALAVIDRPKLMNFLLSMCQSEEKGGGMTMHDGGEVDVRGCYCALCVCHVLGMDGRKVVEACSLGEFVRKCQGHEGGIGGEPGNEGHGGYAFCAYGALALAEASGWLPGGTDMIDRGLLVRWVARMQGNIEGGMRGRTNKLVDGCYSMWQGGLCRLLMERGTAVCQGDDQGDKIKPVPDACEEDTTLGEAVRAWCNSSIDRGGRAAVMEAELDELMERFLIAEERYQSDTSDASAHAVVEALGYEAVRIQNSLQELEEDLKNATNSNRCLHQLLSQQTLDAQYAGGDQIIDAVALQMWILLACQIPEQGGLRDKPGTRPDFYHSCYCLSGLAAAQACSDVVLGGDSNRLKASHAICNVGIDKIKRSIAFYNG